MSLSIASLRSVSQEEYVKQPTAARATVKLDLGVAKEQLLHFQQRGSKIANFSAAAKGPRHPSDTIDVEAKLAL